MGIQEEVQLFLEQFREKKGRYGLIFFEEFSEMLSLEMNVKDRKRIIDSIDREDCQEVPETQMENFVFQVKDGNRKIKIELNLGRDQYPAECLRFHRIK